MNTLSCGQCTSQGAFRIPRENPLVSSLCKERIAIASEQLLLPSALCTLLKGSVLLLPRICVKILNFLSPPKLGLAATTTVEELSCEHVKAHS